MSSKVVSDESGTEGPEPWKRFAPRNQHRCCSSALADNLAQNGARVKRRQLTPRRSPKSDSAAKVQRRGPVSATLSATLSVTLSETVSETLSVTVSETLSVTLSDWPDFDKSSRQSSRQRRESRGCAEESKSEVQTKLGKDKTRRIGSERSKVRDLLHSFRKVEFQGIFNSFHGGVWIRHPRHFAFRPHAFHSGSSLNAFRKFMVIQI